MSQHRILCAVLRNVPCAALLLGGLTIPAAVAQSVSPPVDSDVSGRRILTVSGPTTAEVCPVEEGSVAARQAFAAGMPLAIPPYATRLSSTPVHPEAVQWFSSRTRSQPDASGLTTAPARVFDADPDDAAPKDIDLLNLTGDGTRLDGLYARVWSFKLDPGETSAPGKDGLADFRFDPILGSGAGLECSSAAPDEVAQYCSRFDAVNVYYHVDRVAREYWVGDLGVEIDFQADVMTHGAGDGAVAYPDVFHFRLRAGDIFKKNAALEDEIIYHEYTHLVTARLGFVVDTESSTEERALNEGYADYFAASYTDDPRLGEWVVTCPARQHCVDEFGRENDEEYTRLDLDADVWNWNRGAPDPTLQYGFCLRYHEGDTKCKASYGYFTDVYIWGMIWSNTLWDVRSELGATIADPLFVEAIRMHHGGGNEDVDFHEAAGHVILANRTLNGGQNEALIRDLFEARGYMIAIIDSAEEGASEYALPRAGSIEVYPNPANTTAWIQVDTPPMHDVKIRIVDLLGRTVAVPTPSRPSVGSDLISVDVSGLAPGFYLIEASTSNESTSKRLTIVR